MENSISFIASYYIQNIGLYFLNGIDFGYNKKNEMIYDKIHYNIDFDSSFENSLNAISSISDINFFTYKNMSHYWKNNTLVLCFSDAYECCWNNAFNKSHINHYFILSKTNEGLFTITDPFCDVYDLKLVLNELPKIKNFMLSSVVKNDKKLLVNDIIQKISLRKYIEKNVILFSQDIANINSIEQLFSKKELNVESSILIRRLDRIINFRYNAALYLKTLDEKNIYISDMLLDSYNQWNIVRSMLIRSFITKKISIKENLSERICKIANIEQNIINICEKLI